MRLHSEQHAGPRREKRNGSPGPRSGRQQSEEGCEGRWDAKQLDRDLLSASRPLIASEALVAVETILGSLCARKHGRRRGQGRFGRGSQVYLDLLVAHQVHAGPPMEATRPGTPSERF